MKYKPGDLTSYVAKLDAATSTEYTRPGLIDAENAIREAMRQSDGSEEDATRLVIELAALFGEYTSHINLATHGGDQCEHCLYDLYNRLTHAANYTFRMAREERNKAALAIKDGPKIDPTGPEPGTKVN